MRVVSTIAVGVILVKVDQRRQLWERTGRDKSKHVADPLGFREPPGGLLNGPAFADHAPK
jgi:hypothetical protein